MIASDYFLSLRSIAKSVIDLIASSTSFLPALSYHFRSSIKVFHDLSKSSNWPLRIVIFSKH